MKAYRECIDKLDLDPAEKFKLVVQASRYIEAEKAVIRNNQTGLWMSFAIVLPIILSVIGIVLAAIAKFSGF